MALRKLCILWVVRGNFKFYGWFGVKFDFYGRFGVIFPKNYDM